MTKIQFQRRHLISHMGQLDSCSKMDMKRVSIICPIWNLIQHHKSQKMFHTKRRKIYEFIVDETPIKAGNEFVWLWIATEPSNKAILEMRISYERNILIAEYFTR